MHSHIGLECTHRAILLVDPQPLTRSPLTSSTHWHCWRSIFRSTYESLSSSLLLLSSSPSPSSAFAGFGALATRSLMYVSVSVKGKSAAKYSLLMSSRLTSSLSFSWSGPSAVGVP
eukprot:m.254573 g.254573  ORF g.254573 m.254573 type:complete len:116 (+) comp19148_c0_seq9:1209-1556(+)